MTAYKTISKPSEGLYKEKGSKFLGFAYPVTEMRSIQLILDEIKKKFHDARHHCYAYVIGMDEQEYKANDDGEPNHSAGDPILGQIRAFGLTNVLVVVVRYFGGIKLGVGGLVSAYKTTANETLSGADLIEIYPTSHFSITFPYEMTGEMESLFNDFNLDFEEKSFTDICRFSGKIREEEIPVFRGRLEKTYGITFSLSE